MSEESRRIIERCRFFRKLTRESIDRILKSARLKRFRHGELIFSEGDACPGIFIVGTGAVRIFRNAPNGKQHVLHLAYEGATFAEVAAIGAFNCPAFAEAMQDTVCLLLPKDDFLRDIQNDHELCIQLLGSMAEWVRHLVGMLDDIVLRDATSRVARHLLRAQIPEGQKDIVLPMLKRDLASHLNLTSETLSRTLRRLTDAGLITSQDQHHIRIVDKKELERVAEGSPPAEFT